MDKLTTEMIEALQAHRAEFVKNNPNRCKTERSAERNWRNALTKAWLYDYREQWGILRTVRNEIGIQAAFDQFSAIRRKK